ncbi:MAG: beta-1,3-glucanase family protein [Angustibacter sp.]
MHIPISRRSLFAGAGALAGGLALNGVDRAAALPGPLPVTLINDSKKSVGWFCVVGVVNGRQVYANEAGQAIPIEQAPVGPNGALGIRRPLPPTGRRKLIRLPYMSGRIYVSYDRRFVFKRVIDINGQWGTIHPAGWVPTDPNFNVIYDMFEFTYGGGMFCNTTQVDMASIPMEVTLWDGNTYQRTGRMRDGALHRIANSLANIPGYRGLVTPNRIRILSPSHALGTNFPSNYYDGYINAVWSKYSREDMVINLPTRTVRGRVRNDVLTFDSGSSFRRPTTGDVFGCNGALGAPNDAITGPIAAILGAAFNRSTLLISNVHPVVDPRRFYTANTTNFYAKFLHREHLDGKAYGFPFDDVNQQDATVANGNATAMTLRLTPFSKA